MSADLPLSVRRIWQIDNSRFAILWSDNIEQIFSLSDLQKACPCAACYDEESGKQLVDPKSIDKYLRAKQIESVGRYALRIYFTSGCNYGIYTFRKLREMYSEDKNK